MKEEHPIPPFSVEARCESCQTSYQLVAPSSSAHFCPFCGKPVDPSHYKTLIPTLSTTGGEESISFIQEHLPDEASVQFTIGPYQVLQNIGKGGMGEVFLAYDTTCGRRIALKRIRIDLIDREHMHDRFLREARITSQLTHPAIIPIYVIHGEDNLVYYTMPFVQGETLKQVLRNTRQQEKKGAPLDHIGGSIPALIRIFTTICQAVAYAHSKRVIHRDLKPENIILGKYGEVLILDWGLAKLVDVEEDSTTLPAESSQSGKDSVTRIGKVVGTISYMAPERALGHPATFQTDIYSLGIILYQLLTLRQPFKRGTLQEFKKSVAHEVLIDPALAAPYRDVPPILSRITHKCLAKDLNERYQNVDQLILDLEDYTEGRSDWYLVSDLDVKCKEHWEFQENVLIAEHTAVTSISEEAEWVSLMVSKESFSGNTKIEANVMIGEKGHGIGFLMSIPEASERVHINDGYCLWLGSDINKSTKLLRSSVEVLHAPDIFLKRNHQYCVRIEKIDQTIHLYLNDLLQFSYIAYMPLIGTHVGLLSRDWDYEISALHVYVSSLSVLVNCLSIPDRFLALKDYHKALSEYRRIANSFSGRAEGREALFQAGITLIEEARESPEKEKLLELALKEFEKLHGTPGAPLEYLGKALVYQALNETGEEIKCYELAYRRYGKHPLLPVLQEQIVTRMHGVSRYDRAATYQFILLCIRNLPVDALGTHTRKLFSSLQRHWEALYFILNSSQENPSKGELKVSFAIQLAFSLAKPYVLEEILTDLSKEMKPSPVCISNVIFSLLELGCQELAQEKWGMVKHLMDPSDQKMIDLVFTKPSKIDLEALCLPSKDTLSPEQFRMLLYLLEQALDHGETAFIHPILDQLKYDHMSFESCLQLNKIQIIAYLLDKNWKKAAELISSYPLELLNKETTPLHFLYGCWLEATEGKEIALTHFDGVLDVLYPKSWALGSHYLSNKISSEDNWFKKAFLWEKRQLYRQLTLYYHCSGNEKLSSHFKLLAREEYVALSD
jgi:eukaryotic-like serine/threonine-protein kinase